MGAPIKRQRTGQLPYLSFCYERPFGIELEINATDGKNRPDPGQKPAGIEQPLLIRVCGAPAERRLEKNAMGDGGLRP